MLLAAALLTIDSLVRAASPVAAVVPDAVIIDEVAVVELTARDVDPATHAWVVEAGELESIAGGAAEVRARWRLPLDVKPRRLAAALVDYATPRATFVTVPISRRARVQIEATPLAQVSLFLGNTLAASGTTDAQGKLELRVVVPPASLSARVEQTTRRGQVPPRFDRLDVADELHVFTVPMVRTLVPDGVASAPLATLVYSDGQSAVDAEVSIRAAGKVLRATPITAPGERAARVSAAAAHAAAADALTIITRAAAGERHAEHRATLMFAPLPASTLEVIAPAEPWSAGAPIELAATARDELGRAVATEVSVMALPPHDDLVIDAGDAAHVRLRAPTNIDSALTLEVRATTAATTRRTFRLVAAEPATVRLERAGDHGFMLAVDDAFGNPSPGVTPTLVAGSGEVEALVETAPGRWQGVWVPALADQREETRLNASLPTSSAETVMRHYGSAWAVQVSGYGGALVGRGSLLGVGGLVLVEARLPKLPSRLSIDAAAGGWYAAREQTAEPGLAATRRAALVPLGLGVSWEMPLAIGWRCDVGVMGGVLLTSTSTTVRENGVTVAGPRSLKGSTAQLTPWVRVGRQAGPGLVAVLVSGLIALGGVSTWTEPPLVASLALGYAWEP